MERANERERRACIYFTDDGKREREREGKDDGERREKDDGERREKDGERE